MKQIVGDLWHYYRKPGYVICITINGTVKKNGEAVMGRQAVVRIPGVAKTLGWLLRENGNHVQWLDRRPGVMFFPVKHEWEEQADPKLIIRSAKELGRLAVLHDFTFVLPRPGCGNGGLHWRKVKSLLRVLPDNVWIISTPLEQN